jgi:putative phosphoribosyl transferase
LNGIKPSLNERPSIVISCHFEKAIVLLRAFVDSLYALSGVISLTLGLSQLRFTDRDAAGEMLAEMLRDTLPLGHSELIVLGIPRGGVVVANQVARRFSADLGIIAVKKILAPGSQENAIGAVVFDEREYLDSKLINDLHLTSGHLVTAIAEAKEEAKYRQMLYGQHLLSNIEGKVVILVDDGAATGSTLTAAARFVRKHRPTSLIIAVPIASRTAVMQLEDEANRVVTIVKAKTNFRAVGQFYKSYTPVTYEDVLRILNANKMHSSQ